MNSQPVLLAFGAGTAVLAGYVFIRFSPYRRFRAESLRADRFALHLLGCSVLLYAIGAATDALAPQFQTTIVEKLEKAGITRPILFALIAALPVAFVDSIYTLILQSDDVALKEPGGLWARIRSAAISRYMRACDDAGVRIIYRAFRLKKQLMVTLKSGKVYVGQVQHLMRDPTDITNFVRLMPIASGHRDPLTKKVTLSTPYSILREATSKYETDRTSGHIDDPLRSELVRLNSGAQPSSFDLEDLGVVVLWREIETLMIFDERVYELFQGAAQSKAA